MDEGRLSTSCTKTDTGRWLIDIAAADAEWAANTNSGTGAPAHRKNMEDVHRNPPEPDTSDEPGEESGRKLSYAEARAERERFLAQLARLEYEEKSGALVEAEEVKREAFRLARVVRDGLLNLPDRVAAELAAETNQFVVHRRLTEELRKALEGLQDA